MNWILMKRREALELVMIAAAPIAAQQPHLHTTGDSAPATALRFLSPEEFRLVDRLTEIIIPADAHSPGAHEAKVAAYIDELLADSGANEQGGWRAGLETVESETRKLHGKPFLNYSSVQQDQIMKKMAEGEESPKTGLHRFFIRIKSQTLSGYYTSSAGLLQGPPL
ncbi:MAG: gluconate 2-dehydrogenase subunit 3 family protein [Bryobacterales bacterium]|nr:gluconate 2-dehydrogenase subunit 3 family protein [Bryobacterales bacterium]